MVIWAISLGIVSLIAWVIPLVGVPVCLASIIVGSIALKKKHNTLASAIAIFFGLLGMVLSLINAVLGWVVLESLQFWQYTL